MTDMDENDADQEARLGMPARWLDAAPPGATPDHRARTFPESDDPLVLALQRLVTREGGWANVAGTEVSVQTIYQIVMCKRDSKSKKPKSVGPRVRAYLNAAFPDWLDGGDVAAGPAHQGPRSVDASALLQLAERWAGEAGQTLAMAETMRTQMLTCPCPTSRALWRCALELAQLVQAGRSHGVSQDAEAAIEHAGDGQMPSVDVAAPAGSMSALTTAAKLLGGQHVIARVAQVTPAAVSQWGVARVPTDRCPIIERATDGKVTCEELRPDVRWTRVPDPEWPHPHGRPCVAYGSVPANEEAR